MGESLGSCVQTSLRSVCTHVLGQDSPIQTSWSPCSVNKSQLNMASWISQKSILSKQQQQQQQNSLLQSQKLFPAKYKKKTPIHEISSRKNFVPRSTSPKVAQWYKFIVSSNVYEKITQFWLAESSAVITHRYSGLWLAERQQEIF